MGKVNNIVHHHPLNPNNNYPEKLRKPPLSLLHYSFSTLGRLLLLCEQCSTFFFR